MSRVEETKAQLQEGIKRLTETSVPLEHGRSSAEELQHEVGEHYVALQVILGYFTGLSDRIELEVNRPFGEAHAKYEEAQGLIVPAAQGSAKVAAQAAIDHVTHLEEDAREDIPITDVSMGPNMRGALSALKDAVERVKDIEWILMNAGSNASMIQQMDHSQAIAATEAFKDRL